MIKDKSSIYHREKLFALVLPAQYIYMAKLYRCVSESETCAAGRQRQVQETRELPHDNISCYLGFLWQRI